MGVSPGFPLAVEVVKRACERPETAGRSLSQWDYLGIRRQLTGGGPVDSIGRESIRKNLAAHQLKPWRNRAWLSPKGLRYEAFRRQVASLCDLDTRGLKPQEMVLCMDVMTSLQPRPRSSETRPAGPGRAVEYEHDYSRCRAVNLFAAFDTRTGHVWETTVRRKRPVELIELLEKIDREIPAEKPGATSFWPMCHRTTASCRRSGCPGMSVSASHSDRCIIRG